MKKVRIALAGIGAMGKIYAEMIYNGKIDRAKLTAVCARSAASREWAKRELPGVRTAESLEDLFAEPDDFDAVVIALPHKVHCESALRAFSLGKHVLCEKPISADFGEAIRMQKAAEKAGVKYGVIFQKRTFECYQKIKELLGRKAVGRIVRASFTSSQYYRTPWYHSSGAWRSSWTGEGGGALMNQAQHPLDIFQWLMGMPQELYAKISFGKYNNFLVEDEAHLLMNYESGLHSDFFFTTGEGVPQSRFEIVGTKGKLLLEDERLTLYTHEDIMEYGKRVHVNSREELKIINRRISVKQTQNAYERVLENFICSVLDDEPLLVSGDEGINSLILTNAAYLSAYKNRPVTLPPPVEEYDAFLQEMMAKEYEKKNRE